MKKTWKIDLVNSECGISFTYHGLIDVEPEHDHEFMEIEYVVKGSLTQIINGVKYDCKEGDFLFFYVGDTHQMIPKGKDYVVVQNLIFHPRLFDEMMLKQYFPIDKRVTSMVNVPPAEAKHAKSIFYMMQKEWKKQNEGYIFVLHSLLQSLITILLRYGYRKERFDDRVEQIIAVIDSDITLTVGEIADKCGFCTNHLERIFKKNMGTTINEYLIKKRVEKAYNLIKTTDYSVDRIMEEINLSNKTYFYSIFKKHTGKTPGEVRKK